MKTVVVKGWKLALGVFAVGLWGSVTFFAFLAYWHTIQLNQGLIVQIDLLNQLRVSETEKCAGIYRVNEVCEKVVTGFATQLGLDTLGTSTLLTTGIKERHQAGGIGGE